MIKLNTERLSIFPLDEYNLELSIKDFNKMEKNLDLTITNKNIGVREKNVFKIRLNGVKNNHINYMWYTNMVYSVKGRKSNCWTYNAKGLP